MPVYTLWENRYHAVLPNFLYPDETSCRSRLFPVFPHIRVIFQRDRRFFMIFPVFSVEIRETGFPHLWKTLLEVLKT